jgi:diacylglycerol kinase (ATP)
MSVAVVVNPIAGNGRMGRRWPKIEAALAARLGPLTVMKTDAPGETCDLARQLAMEGAELVIAAGGDGTISDSVNGLMQAREAIGRATDLGIVPVGIRSDFARGLGREADVERIAARIAGGERRTIDVGRICFVTDDGALHSRCFVNIASLGISGPTDRAVNSARRGGRLLGTPILMFHTIRELIRYRFQEVRITIDDGEPIEARIALVAVANAPYFGGGMKIAPDAEPDDQQFEVVVVRGRSKLSLISDLRLVHSGAHKSLGSCSFASGRKVVVEPLGNLAANAALLDVDGESPGRIPATFEIIPAAITVRG